MKLVRPIKMCLNDPYSKVCSKHLSVMKNPIFCDNTMRNSSKLFTWAKLNMAWLSFPWRNSHCCFFKEKIIIHITEVYLIYPLAWHVLNLWNKSGISFHFICQGIIAIISHWILLKIIFHKNGAYWISTLP